MRRKLEPFRFKQFTVKHSDATLAVGTDAILLAAWVGLEKRAKILEVGTGCGLISLGVAQRNEGDFSVRAIDIDELSVKEAQFNFENSKWSSNLVSEHISFEALDVKNLDLIISNPPFFRDSLKNEKEHKVKARHQDSFSMVRFAEFCKGALNPKGGVAMVYPYSDLGYLKSVFKKEGFDVSRVCLVQPKYSKPINRVLIEFSKNPTSFIEEQLIIREVDNTYTDDYKLLTKAYYLNF